MIKKIASGFSALVLSLSSLFVFAPMMASAAVDTCTWDASSSSAWATAANWTCTSDGSAVPGTGDSLVFDNTGLTLEQATITGASGSFANITFQGSGAQSIGIDGSAITVTGSITASAGSHFPTVNADMVLTGNKTISTASDGTLSLSGDLTGSANLTKSGAGSLYLTGDNSDYTGSITASAGRISADSKGLATSGGTTIADGAGLTIGACASPTFEGDLTLTGDSEDPESEKIYSYAFCGGGGGGGTDEVYGIAAGGPTLTLSGDIHLGSDVTYNSASAVTKLTGAISGKHKMKITKGSAAKIVIDSSSNDSSMNNGTNKADPIVKTLSDKTNASVSVYGTAVITIKGKRGEVYVNSGGTLKGTGTVGLLSIGEDGNLAPGNSPGCLASGNLSILGGEYQAEIGGTTACSGYDQMKVNGTVTLSDDDNAATLSASIVNDYKPVVGAKYVIISNNGSDKVVGTFDGLKEGATFKTASDSVLKVSYKGGTGNDVELTMMKVGAPDTGFGMLLNNPAAILAASALAAGAILLMSRKFAPATAAKRRSRR